MKENIRILITSTNSGTLARRLVKRAQCDRFKRHSLTDDPAQADVILFVEQDRNLNSVKATAPYIDHPEKCLVYSTNDRPYGFSTIPGLIVSLKRSATNPYLHRSAPYFHLKNAIDPNFGINPAYLFSFVGSVRGVAVRKRIIQKIKHAACFIQDTSDYQMFKSQVHAKITNLELIEQQRKIYADVILQSKFVLCPRGSGVSSFRLYETMHAGRVPVVISDEWIPPFSADWGQCAIIVPEREVDKIPELLNDYEPYWKEIGHNARKTWESFFGPESVFHWTAEACKSILYTRHLSILWNTKMQSRIGALRRGLRPIRWIQTFWR